MRKGTKWAIIAISCCLLASLARACAPKYDQTKAQSTNNQTPAFNYVEEFEQSKDQFDEIFGQDETQTNSLGK